jgi:type IV pilus assembly protein PilC
MASMTGAGLSLVRALRSASRDSSSARFSRMVEDVARRVEEGQSLSQAMAAYPGTFDRIYTGLIQTAEVSGNLDTTFAQLAEYLERSEIIRAKVKAALRYPYFVFGTMIAVLALMLLKIIPMFAKIYQGLDFPLPRPTQILVNVSTTLVHNLPIVLGVVVGIVVLARIIGSTTRGRLALDHLKLKIPVLGKLLHLYTISRFARTLGILLASGTQILYALEVSRAVAGSLLFEQRIDRVRQEVESGVSMAVAMGHARLFPETMLQMIATGEETGRLDDMLVRCSNFYEQQVTAAVDGLSSLIEPVIIVTLGSIVGTMILALYYPIFMMGTAIRSGM